jgi:hypothetical protein
MYHRYDIYILYYIMYIQSVDLIDHSKKESIYIPAESLPTVPLVLQPLRRSSAKPRGFERP